MAVKREKIKFASVEELLGAPQVTNDHTTEIRIDDIKPFKNHPFKVRDDQKMDELVESIRDNGILFPVLVRPGEDGRYEMISGHRRMHAARMVGLRTIPALIREMSDDEATVAMVDANVQREEILPSERAYSLKMKIDAIKRQGKRTDLTSRTECEKLFSGAAEEAGWAFGLKARQVQKYLRLVNLNDKLLDLVDRKKIPINTAVDISYFNPNLQKWLYEYIKENGFLIPKQIAALKKLPNLDNVTQYIMVNVLNDAVSVKKGSGKVILSEKKLGKYFSPSISTRERERIILELLDHWKKEGDGEA